MTDDEKITPTEDENSLKDEVNVGGEEDFAEGDSLTADGEAAAAVLTPATELKKARSVSISKKAVLIGAAVVLALFVTAYILTFVLEKGAYQRDASGAIIPGTYVADPTLEGIKWWQFLLSPLMILMPTSDGYMTVWAIIILLFIIGAVFTALDETGIMVYMVEYLNHKLGHRKYLLLFLLCFAFMFLGSTAGMFEELIPLVPVVVMLCYALGRKLFRLFGGRGQSLHRRRRANPRRTRNVFRNRYAHTHIRARLYHIDGVPLPLRA